MEEPDPEEFVEMQNISDFTQAVVHLYRGEMQRAYNWRIRLDNTTNWAIILLSAVITWTFTDPKNPHELLLLSLFFITMLLGIEARRYMFFNVWNSRVRALEENLMARILNPKKAVTSRQWMKKLASDLSTPAFKITYWHAVSHRIRRVYIWLFTLVIALWYSKLILHPVHVVDFNQFVSRAEFMSIPGFVVFPVITSILVVLFLISLTTPRVEHEWDRIRKDSDLMKDWDKNM